MRAMNLDQLRTFVEVVAEGNFSAAGRRLNLTQPAVSLHIRELEKRFGVRLVDRVGRRAYPTAPGMDLAGHARRMPLAPKSLVPGHLIFISRAILIPQLCLNQGRLRCLPLGF